MATFVRNVGDTLTTATDSVLKTSSLVRSVIESLSSILYGVGVYGQNGYGGGSVYDGIQRILGAVRSVIESNVVTDITSRLKQALRTVAETAATSDSVVVFAFFIGIRWIAAGIIHTQNRLLNLTTQLRSFIMTAGSHGLLLTGVDFTMGSTDAQPYNIDVATTETPAYTFDVTQYLSAGQTVANPVQSMKILAGGVSVIGAFSGVPSISANLIQIKIVGSSLTTGQKYRCVITFDVQTAGVTQSTLSSNVIVNVPY